MTPDRHGRAGRPARPAARGERRVRKNMAMDGRKLALAKSWLGAETETDAVDRALDLVAFQAEVFGALDALASGGPVRAPFARRQAVAKFTVDADVYIEALRRPAEMDALKAFLGAPFPPPT